MKVLDAYRLETAVLVSDGHRRPRQIAVDELHLAKEFTDDPVPDSAILTILDNARFAPSGGNRQGWRIINVQDTALRPQLADLSLPAATRYRARPWILRSRLARYR